MPSHSPLKVTYTGALTDLSGYASAARDYIRALDAVGFDVAAESRTFEPQSQYLIEEVVDRKLWTMMGKNHGALGPQIIHLTPDNYREYADRPTKKIGYYAWETSKLPPAWVPPINEVMGEVWVPCEYLRRVSINSGVKVPVRVVPHAIPMLPDGWTSGQAIRGLPNGSFKFYSVFQWSERKNPYGTLQAYYEEFDRYDPVIFVLKTYRAGNATGERDFIRREIARLKRATKGVECPPVLLIEEFLGASEIQTLHQQCDCYVSMARSEGFGIPAFEAAAVGNPVIVPRYSAFPEYLSDDNSYLVSVPNEIPIRDMQHISILYTGDMLWGDPSVEDCKRKMREAFEDQTEAKNKGLRAREYVKENLSHKTVGRMMKGFVEAFWRRNQD